MIYRDYEQSTKVRDSYTILPFQGIWTWLTGMALDGQKPLWRKSSSEMLLWSILWVMAGLMLTNYAMNASSYGIIFYMIGAVLSASGARYIVATIIHQGVHHTLFKTKAMNKVACEILSTIFIVQPYDTYREFHVKEHHGADFSTLKDKDLSAIYKLGFYPGRSKNRMYINLLLLCINPVFHLNYLAGRIASNLRQVTQLRRLGSILWLTFLTCLGLLNGLSWMVLVIGIPFVVIYQVASIIHLLTEHVWLTRDDHQSVRDSHINNSLGRFCGSQCPPSFSMRYWGAWFFWAISHLLYHLPCRILIVQGSLTCHDWHHRFGGRKDWYNFSVNRRVDAKRLFESSKYDYTDAWGILNALDYVLENIAQAEHVEFSSAEHRLN